MKLFGTLTLFILLPLSVLANSNAGIVQGLWYSQEQFFADSPIRVYVAIRNNTGADLRGTVEFYVNDERVERNSINALDGRIVESWADWTPRYGTSTVSATLTRTEISSTASGTQGVQVTSALAEDIIFVDYDTDSDGIGNAIDPDDDNDGVSDSEEVEQGTDPLTYDTDETTDEGESLTTDTSVHTTSSDEPAGLEQYLNDNRVARFLSSITDTINANKERLDSYRSGRRAPGVEEEVDVILPSLAVETGLGTGTDSLVIDIGGTFASSTVSTSTDEPISHIGEITRTTDTSGSGINGVLKNIWGAITLGAAVVYDKILWLIAAFLAHPVLVQVTLLCLLLFLVLKIARRVSQRTSE